MSTGARPCRTLARAAILAAAASILGGCAGSDGGPVGTGKIATLVGNVVSVEAESTQRAAAAGGSVAEIDISVVGRPELATRTDADGRFTLSGDLSGRASLRFTTPSFEVTEEIDVPSGSVLVLADLELAPEGAVALTARQLDFVGRVVQTECEAGVLLVDDGRARDAQFLVRLASETRLARGPERVPVACSEIRPGAHVLVEGTVRIPSDGAIDALLVVVEPARGRPGGGPRTVAFAGRAAVVACERAGLVLDDRGERTRLRLGETTAILDQGGSSIRCAEIGLGDLIVGEGVLDLSRPALVDAKRLTVREAGSSGNELRVFGFVAEVACDQRLLRIGERGGGLARIRLLPTTEIRPPLACEEIEVGLRAAAIGRPSREGRGTLEASRLTLRRPQR